MVERRAGAPRLIEWTGERCVPWTPEVWVAYEHYHRYLWAAALVEGRRVLDLASGEGFGSAILAEAAESVTGVDVDPTTVAHAEANYAAPNLRFQAGSALDLSEFDDGAFEAVVAFELIEHLSEHDRLLAEIDRVLDPEGVAILSTPDRRVYSEAKDEPNPFHERELTEAEFREVLGARFEHVSLWGQATVNGSRIAALDDGGAGRSRDFVLERTEDGWRPAAEPSPVYLVAVAAHASGVQPPIESNLADYGLGMVVEKERELVEGRVAVAHAEAAVRRAEGWRIESEFLHSLIDGGTRARTRWVLANTSLGRWLRARGLRRPSGPDG